MSKAKGLLSNNFRLFLFVAVFAAVIYLVVRNISVFGNILLVALGFGAVVLVHEFGHFIVAKLTGIKVEAFSIGFPPILAGILRTERGWRVRILPRFFPGENRSGDPGAPGLSFTIGKKTRAGAVRSKLGKPDAPPVAGTSNGAGETEYRIGLIPFGGFVKMLGQDDIGPVKASDDPRSYANKPVGVRMAVITAGVVFNAISAILIFMIVFLIGIKLAPAMVGGVRPNSPASRAGLTAGDEIIEIAGKSDNLDFSDIKITAALSDINEEVPLKIRHKDGSEEDFSLVAEQMLGERLRNFGVMQPMSLTIAEVFDVNTLHERTGLLPGDRIKAVNGRDVQNHWELAEIVQNALAPAVTVLAERTETDSKEVGLIEVQLNLLLPALKSADITSESSLRHIYSIVPRLRITAVVDKPTSIKDRIVSLLSKIGIGKEVTDKPKLQVDDIMLAIGDVENPTYKEMREVTEEYEDRELPIKVLRVDINGVEKTLAVTVVPKRPPGGERVVIGIFVALDTEHPIVAKTIVTEDGPAALAIPRGAAIMAVDGVRVSNFYEIIREMRRNAGQRITIDYRLDEKIAGDIALDLGGGKEFITVKSILAESVPFEPLERLYKASGPVDAIGMGYRRTVMFIVQAYVTLQRVVGGLVSPKSFIGPVGIVTLSYRIVAEQPLVYYVYFLGLISAFIAVFNFLPLLPFDGGHIVLLLVEKVKGSALSERVQGAIAYAGLVLIGAFFLYVTFNDIVRSFFR